MCVVTFVPSSYRISDKKTGKYNKHHVNRMDFNNSKDSCFATINLASNQSVPVNKLLMDATIWCLIVANSLLSEMDKLGLCR